MGMSMDKETLLVLYGYVLDEERFFAKEHQDRISFYSGFITTIIAAIVLGSLQASTWYHFAILSVGPLVLFLVAQNAVEGCYRSYLRFLEAITYRAKIEQNLGLTQKLLKEESKREGELYWENEPLVPSRHLMSRRKYVTSEEFILRASRGGYYRVVVRLFRTVQGISVLMFVGLVGIAVWMAL